MNIHTQSFCNLEWSNSLRKVMRVEWSDYEDFTHKYQTANPTELETAQQIMYIFNFFEGLGVYVRDGLIDVRLVALTMTAPIVMTWEKYAPMMMHTRERLNQPRFWSEFEYLYDKVQRYNKEHLNI
jgi:hypothetical protein